MKTKLVYAYGVEPLYGSISGKHIEVIPGGMAKIFEPYAYLHYWVDEGLECGHEQTLCATMPKDVSFVQDDRYSVELRGPGDYTVKFR